MMIARNLTLLVAISLMTLTACSNGKFTYGKAFGDLSTITGVKTGLEVYNASASQGTAAAPAPTGPPLIVGFEEIRVALPYAGDSGDSKTYVSPDGVTLAMTSGFVTRATGLGIDMNGTYLPSDSPWFKGLKQAANENASTDRVVEYWEKGRIKRDKFRCTLVSSARDGGGSIIDETCKRFFEPETFVNRYWIAADNTVECSRQWLHPKLAPLQFFFD